MYIRVRSHHPLGESVGPYQGTLTGSLLGNAEIFLFLNDRLGGGKHWVIHRTEEAPAEIELYPYERVAMQVFKFMDGPYNIAAEAKGKWVRFDMDVGWLFWLRIVNSRAELKLAPETQATFSEILRQLQLLALKPEPAPISLELADAPQASTSEGRVFLWMVKNISGIVAMEQKFSIDRRAIAGAIAWEALQNAYTGPASDLATSAGVARFSGPGKVHYKEFRTEEGNPVARQVEQLGRLPMQSMEGRRKILATMPGALLYIGTIMREFSNAAAQGGYYLDCDPPILTTFYNGSWSIQRAQEFFQNERKAPTILRPGPLMGSWVQANIRLIERMVGKPPAGFCRKQRGY